MVSRAGGYYGASFKRAQVVTQGDPLSPTILNVVVDAVVRNWVAVIVEGAEEQGERGKEGRHQNSLFYVEDGMVASSDPQWLRVNLVPGSAYSIGWACGKIPKRHLAWSAANAKRQGPSWRRRTGDG